jgi:hypothetical protein
MSCAVPRLSIDEMRQSLGRATQAGDRYSAT